jgi:hypothetical protein
MAMFVYCSDIMIRAVSRGLMVRHLKVFGVPYVSGMQGAVGPGLRFRFMWRTDLLVCGVSRWFRVRSGLGLRVS